jgi:hypothetical protein
VRATVLRRIAKRQLANSLHIDVQVSFILCKVKRAVFKVRFEVRLSARSKEMSAHDPVGDGVFSKTIVVINIDQCYHMPADIIQEDDPSTFNSRYLLHKDLLRE